MYRTSPRFPPVYLFFFGVQNHFFFCKQKKKWFWPQPGRQKTNCKIKHPTFPTKEKAVSPRGVPPSVRRQSRATSAPLPKTTPQAAWIPTNKERYSTHSTAVAQKGPRVAQTQVAGNKRDTRKSFTRGIIKQGWGFVRLYRTSPRFPPVYLFFFGVQNHFFFC